MGCRELSAKEIELMNSAEKQSIEIFNIVKERKMLERTKDGRLVLNGKEFSAKEAGLINNAIKHPISHSERTLTPMGQDTVKSKSYQKS